MFFEIFLQKESPRYIAKNVKKREIIAIRKYVLERPRLIPTPKLSTDKLIARIRDSKDDINLLSSISAFFVSTKIFRYFFCFSLKKNFSKLLFCFSILFPKVSKINLINPTENIIKKESNLLTEFEINHEKANPMSKDKNKIIEHINEIKKHFENVILIFDIP